MKYMLMFCSDQASGLEPDEEESTAMAGCDEWAAEMQRRGILLSREGLQPVSDSTTLRVRQEQVLLSDGPFAETKDQIGGFSLIECPDLDGAIEVAASHPWAQIGQVEIRPVWQP
ncbi:transcription initiation protein [Actinomadura sp. CNU-125]|uniref:YciI family protein n=1 Tax=Actinomadura sp. CNU-125 TaxID=1904961 RepID=UPI0009653909|nr:YciI family protein [Actinomadura sp. CNU-125]OLT19132.1 transcription initiation protein [Actinomadura sp. CNU-125]